MKITIGHLLEGAREAEGLTVIIDVFRAFSTACYAVEKELTPVYPVGSLQDAFLLKEKLGDAVMVGERHERRPEGFDLGNSPFHLINSQFYGKPMIHTTSSGTQGIMGASGANVILTGSFVNAEAIVQYIRSAKPERVSLVAMGYACLYPTDEDTLCAEYIKNELEGRSSNFSSIKEVIRKGSGARFFEAESQSWAPKEDFDLCLSLNRFSFVLKAMKNESALFLQKVKIS